MKILTVLAVAGVAMLMFRTSSNVEFEIPSNDKKFRCAIVTTSSMFSGKKLMAVVFRLDGKGGAEKVTEAEIRGDLSKGKIAADWEAHDGVTTGLRLKYTAERVETKVLDVQFGK